MRKIALLIYFTATLAAGSAQAGRFPEKLTYRIYVGGQYAGTSVIESGETETSYTFKSKSEVQTQDFYQGLECYSEFDKETLAPKYYSYRGKKVDQEISGVIEFDGKTIKGDLEVNGTAVPSQQPAKEKVVLFEHYTVEHQTILLATLASATDVIIRFDMFFPSDFMQVSTLALIESEVELPLQPKPAACQKYSISIKSSDTFLGYFDPVRQAAVYMDFPAVGVEIFLESAWGENPPIKYVPVSAGETPSQ